MTQLDRARSRGAAALGLMAVSTTLFSLMNFLVRLASDSASWTTVAAVRSIVGAAVAAAVATARGRSLVPNDGRALFWRSLLGTLALVATFYALSAHSLSLGNTVTLLNLAPVFLAVLAPIFLGERTTFAIAFALIFALSGVVLVVRPSFLFGGDLGSAVAVTGPSAGVAAAVAVFGALATSAAMMALRRVGQKESVETISFHFAMFAAITMSVLALFDFRMPTPRDAVFMVLAGLCGGIAQLSMTKAYALEQAARVSAMSYLSPVISALLGAAALHERPGALTVFGMLLVIGAGLLVTFVRPSPPARDNLGP